MPAPHQNIFAHRLNLDGSFDSICRKCYRTAVRAESKAELIFYECRHVCEVRKLPSRVENLILALDIVSREATAVEVTDGQYAQRIVAVRAIIRDLQEALAAREWQGMSAQSN